MSKQCEVVKLMIQDYDELDILQKVVVETHCVECEECAHEMAILDHKKNSTCIVD
ncbi:hypothetical protein K9M79_05660 [Candidatus Woesearchaeota archaeon]|nr:hypothetical protein [Candidatus Woesearchaeota archaeon]